MAHLFSAPHIPKTAAPVTPPGINDMQVRDAGRNAMIAAAKASGFGSTILTSGAGDTSQATVQKKQLLGG